jgi:hypothetical protein
MVMSVPNNPIFRDNAVKHYMQSKDKDTLPRFISLPMALFLWILLGLLLVLALLAWYQQIPTYVSGHGIALRANYVPSSASHDKAVAVAFFAVDQANQLHIGQSVLVSFASSTQSLTGRLLRVDPIVSPTVALQRYGLGSDGASLITQPSVAAIIKLNNTSPALYVGNILTVNVQVGSCRIISLLPGIGRLLGK